MKDTAFHVPPEKIDRLPAFYFFNHQTNKLDFFDDVATSPGSPSPSKQAEGMIGILFTQRMMASPGPLKVFSDFWTPAYGAME
jgi:hypothetical protein